MWEVHHEGKVRTLTEADLRAKLRDNKLAGVELARRKGEASWAPLYSTQLYRNVVPHSQDPTKQVRQRIIRPFMGHLTAFITVLGALWFVSGDPPLWGAFWGIGLAFHAIGTLRKLGELPAAESSVATAISSIQPQTSKPTQLTDNEVLRAIEELDQANWSGDTQALRDTAALLTERRALVDDATDGDAKAALETERSAVLADREEATASTQAMLDDQLRAIDARLRFLNDVQQLGIRLRAQERTLLHQVESLRLGQISATEDASVPDLMQAVTRLRRELDAESEVADALARAHQSARL